MLLKCIFFDPKTFNLPKTSHTDVFCMEYFLWFYVLVLTRTFKNSEKVAKIWRIFRNFRLCLTFSRDKTIFVKFCKILYKFNNPCLNIFMNLRDLSVDLNKEFYGYKKDIF